MVASGGRVDWKQEVGGREATGVLRAGACITQPCCGRAGAPRRPFSDATGRTWIWSDLHLGHAENTIGAFDRPFLTVPDDCLVDAWRNYVADDDTILCLGDVGVDGSLHGRRLDRPRSMPGRALLVPGTTITRLPWLPSRRVSRTFPERRRCG